MPEPLADAIDALRTSLTGRVVTPADADFDPVRTGYNLGGVHRPDVVVVAADAADIAAAVRIAHDHDLPLAVRATGHGPTELLTSGVLVVTSALDQAVVDGPTATVRVGAGATWGAVAQAAEPFGLAPPMGSSPGVGVVGYALGGGLSLFGRTSGWAADQVTSLDLVLADGSTRTVDETSEPDLFWAVRDGGGGFGVVTALTIGLVTDGRLYGGSLFFDVADTELVLRGWAAWTHGLPDSMSTSVACTPFPDLPQVPEPFRGRRLVAIRIAHLGDPAEGERLVEPLRALAPIVHDTVAELAVTAAGSISMDPEDPGASRIDHTLLRELPAEAIDVLADALGPDATEPYLGEIRLLGGRLATVPAAGSPIGNRDAAFLVCTITPVFSRPPADAEYAAARARHELLLGGLAPWSTGGHLFNWLDADATDHVIESAFDPAALPRLRAVMAAVDPDDRLRFNATLPPAPAAAS